MIKTTVLTALTAKSWNHVLAPLSNSHRDAIHELIVTFTEVLVFLVHRMRQNSLESGVPKIM